MLIGEQKESEHPRRIQGKREYTRFGNVLYSKCLQHSNLSSLVG